MRYQVPQFLEVEDKIFGGVLTFKQFLYVAAGGALAFIFWTILPKFIAIIVATPFVVFFVALAFYKVNNRPLSFTVENFFKYLFADKLYLWKKVDKPAPIKQKAVAPTPANNPKYMPRLANSRLKEISWSVDVDENVKDKFK